jgi:CRP/FNR family cyclic AMP-dependent transcriptional regulator
MSAEAPQTDNFREWFRYQLARDSLNFRIIKVRKHENIYVSGDHAEALYYIDSGQIKLLMLSPEGKECILAVYTQGDTFGESCLTGKAPRQETATAMESTILRRIPCDLFLSHLTKHSLLDKFLKYLVARIAEQQQLIAHLLTLDGEHMLAWIILLLARKVGRSDPPNSRIEHKISHDELSEMVGTTRPRVTEFMRRFRDLGLIEITSERFLIVNEEKLAHYLAHVS